MTRKISILGTGNVRLHAEIAVLLLTTGPMAVTETYRDRNTVTLSIKKGRPSEGRETWEHTKRRHNSKI